MSAHEISELFQCFGMVFSGLFHKSFPLFLHRIVGIVVIPEQMNLNQPFQQINAAFREIACEALAPSPQRDCGLELMNPAAETGIGTLLQFAENRFKSLLITCKQLCHGKRGGLLILVIQEAQQMFIIMIHSAVIHYTFSGKIPFNASEAIFFTSILKSDLAIRRREVPAFFPNATTASPFFHLKRPSGSMLSIIL